MGRNGDRSPSAEPLLREPFRFSGVVALAVGLIALALIPLACSTSIPWVGWPGQHLAATWIFLPGLLVGWAALPGRRIAPALLTLLAALAVFLPRTAYYAIFFVFLIPIIFLICFWIGVGLRRLSRFENPGPATLALLAAGLLGVLAHLWFVDGWRYVVRETGMVREMARNNPENLLMPRYEDWHNGLMLAAETARARGDLGQTRAILHRAERAARATPYPTVYPDARLFLHEVAQAEVQADDEPRAMALLFRSEPDPEKRQLVLIRGLLAKGDFGRAWGLIAPLGVKTRVEAYKSFAEAAGCGGHAEEARAAIRELSEIPSQPPPAPGYRSYEPALIEAGSCLYADAVERVRRDPGVDPVKTMYWIVETAWRNRAHPAPPETVRGLYREIISFIETRPDAQKRDSGFFLLSQKQQETHLWEESLASAARIENPEMRQRRTEEVQREHDRWMSRTPSGGLR